MLSYADGTPFDQGSCGYDLRRSYERDTTDRILVPVAIEGRMTQAALDTGGVYLVCDPELASQLNLNPADGLGSVPLLIRGNRVLGDLHRVAMMLLATEGQNLELEVTAFVPKEVLPLPSFMGLTGCLEWIRFAVDPTTQTFYFGAADAV